MKSVFLVMRLLTTEHAEIARAAIQLDDIAPANVNSQCRYQVEAYLEQREIIARGEAPYWNVET
jgi:hypothetical protein